MTSSIKSSKEADRVFRMLSRLPAVMRLAQKEAYELAGIDMARLAKKKIQDPPKTGRIYRISGKKHQASAPGQAPARLTGRLQKSIGYETRGLDQLEVGANTPYAPGLELGNSKRNLEARPFLKPSIDENERNLVRYYIRSVEKLLNA